MVITLLLLLIRSNVLPPSPITMFGLLSPGIGVGGDGSFSKGEKIPHDLSSQEAAFAPALPCPQSGAQQLPKALVSLARGRSLLLFGLTKPVSLFSWGMLAASLFQIFISIMNGSSGSI